MPVSAVWAVAVGALLTASVLSTVSVPVQGQPTASEQTRPELNGAFTESDGLVIDLPGVAGAESQARGNGTGGGGGGAVAVRVAAGGQVELDLYSHQPYLVRCSGCHVDAAGGGGGGSGGGGCADPNANSVVLPIAIGPSWDGYAQLVPGCWPAAGDRPDTGLECSPDSFCERGNPAATPPPTLALPCCHRIPHAPGSGLRSSCRHVVTRAAAG